MAKATDIRATPKAVVRRIEREFELTFDLDAAAIKDNRVVSNYFGPDHEYRAYRNALSDDLRWPEHASCVWLNMPYSEIGVWLAKVHDEIELHDKSRFSTFRVVALLPSSTSTQWWHRYVWNRFKRDWRTHVRRVQFWPKRIEFGPHRTGAKWPSVVVEFGRGEK